AGNPIAHEANLYPTRNTVKPFFCTMKKIYRLSSRFEKPSKHFKSMQSYLLETVLAEIALSQQKN
ncbi:MAG: hypothetical protein AAFY32_02940, partial [Pseudomonadota bacterium]